MKEFKLFTNGRMATSTIAPSIREAKEHFNRLYIGKATIVCEQRSYDVTLGRLTGKAK